MSDMTFAVFRHLRFRAGDGGGNIVSPEVMAYCEDQGWIEGTGLSEEGRAVYEAAKADPPRRPAVKSNAIRSHPFAT